MAGQKRKQQQETVVEEQPLQQETEVETTEIELTLEQRIAEIKNTISGVKNTLRSLEHSFRDLAVQYKHESKQKRKRRSERPAGEKKGEFKSVQLSPQLADFLGVPREEAMKRSEVSKLVYSYINKNNCYFPDRPKTIMKPDSKLTKLFGGKLSYPINSKNPDLGNGLSIYNMQKYLQDHFQTAA